jgi:predicted RNA methylase
MSFVDYAFIRYISRTIVSQILKVTANGSGTTKTKIMYKAFLSQGNRKKPQVSADIQVEGGINEIAYRSQIEFRSGKYEKTAYK